MSNGYSAHRISAQSLTFIATAEVVSLALRFAEEAGEEVKRPLSRDQMGRAYHALYQERAHYFDLLESSGLLLGPSD